jgi:hypothetical protein
MSSESRSSFFTDSGRTMPSPMPIEKVFTSVLQIPVTQ